MYLIIDIGNSRVKYFWQKNTFLSAVDLMQELISLDITGNLPVLLISSVPKQNKMILQELQALLVEISPEIRLEVEIFDPSNSGIERLYSGIGADRVAKLQAAINLQKGRNVAVFDFGTATTVTAARYEDGKYIFDQGLIALGLYASLEAISEKCSELPNLLEQFKTLVEASSAFSSVEQVLQALSYRSETERAIFVGTLKAHRAMVREWKKSLEGFFIYGVGDLAKLFAEDFDALITDSSFMSALITSSNLGKLPL